MCKNNCTKTGRSLQLHLKWKWTKRLYFGIGVDGICVPDYSPIDYLLTSPPLHMDPSGSELDSSLPLPENPCLIVEDSQPDSPALEDDPESSYRTLLAKRLSNLQPPAPSPVLVSGNRFSVEPFDWRAGLRLNSQGKLHLYPEA